MVDSIASAATTASNLAVANQVTTSAAKTALDIQKQEGEAILNLIETASSVSSGNTGNIIDITV